MRTLNVYPQHAHTDPSALTRKDFVSDQEVRWCPGCGDYSVLAQVQRVLPSLGIPREKYVFVSGIGCSSRFPYYLETFGIHSIHGRAPAIATGVKSSRPDLAVWVVTGDGDALSIGGNHFMHVLRRNVDLKLLLFNNRIYGLTKGQYSPTSPAGKRTKSSPMGSLDYPVDPISLALGAGGTFIARCLDVHAGHLQTVLKRAAEHKGTAFVEIYQNCNIFNDGAFSVLTEKETRSDHVVEIEHGKPLRFGKNLEKGIALDADLHPKIVDVASYGEDKLFVHNEQSEIAALVISRLTAGNLPVEQTAGASGAAEFPTPIGVFRAVSRPSYDALMNEQIERAKQGTRRTVQELLDEGQWTVK